MRSDIHASKYDAVGRHHALSDGHFLYESRCMTRCAAGMTFLLLAKPITDNDKYNDMHNIISHFVHVFQFISYLCPRTKILTSLLKTHTT